MSERCDIPQVGDCIIVPDGATVPPSVDPAKVFRFPVSAYNATVMSRFDTEPAGAAAAWSQPLSNAFRKAAKGLHKTDVRAMRQKVHEWLAEGVSEDDIVLRLNRGAISPDEADDIGG